jgi:hypothetical protein|tara:strand:+ start:699 stop:995 length:297 start_codon:yes stop_codon:yes gene_type:complete
MKVSEETQVTLDLKTIGIIVGFVVSISSMYFVLKSDIARAMEEPQPEVTKIEYEYKDLLVRESVLRLEEKQEIMGEDIKEVKGQLDKIDQRLYELSIK